MLFEAPCRAPHRWNDVCSGSASAATPLTQCMLLCTRRNSARTTVLHRRRGSQLTSLHLLESNDPDTRLSSLPCESPLEQRKHFVDTGRVGEHSKAVHGTGLLHLETLMSSTESFQLFEARSNAHSAASRETCQLKTRSTESPRAGGSGGQSHACLNTPSLASPPSSSCPGCPPGPLPSLRSDPPDPENACTDVGTHSGGWDTS